MDTAVQKVDIIDLSKFIINYYCVTKDKPATNLELQKVLYYLQAYHLVNFDKHPFFVEQPEAWVRGPVYRKVYDEYKKYGSDPIQLDSELPIEQVYKESLNKLNLSENQLEFIDAALNFFSNMTYGELITRTHAEKPWNEARNGIGLLEYSNQVISHDMMYDYYKRISEKNR